MPRHTKAVAVQVKDERRSTVGYDANPPTCAQCVHFRPSNHAKGLRPYCVKNKFHVVSQGICDRWKSPSGETLEP